MANIGDSINDELFNSLQIKIYTGATGSDPIPQTPSSDPGIISFNQKDQWIGINGVWYKTASSEAFNEIKDIVEKLDGNTGVTGSVAQQILAKVGDLAGITGVTGANVTEYTTNLYNKLHDEITGAEATANSYTDTKISGLTGSASGTDANSFVTVTVNTAGGEVTGVSVNTNDIAKGTDLNKLQTAVTNMQKTGTGTGEHVTVTVAVGASGPTVTVNETGIASATGLAAVKATADSAVQSVNTKTGTAITLNGADINVGPTGDTGAYGQSSIQVAIQDLADKYAHIDKDSFVHSGSLVYGPADNIEGKHNSRPAGVTGTKSETVKDPYIELVIKEHQSNEAQEIVEAYVYIKATSLVDIYGGATGTVTGVTGDSSTQITVSGTSISAAVSIKNATETGTVTGSVPQTGTAASEEDFIMVANEVSVKTEAGTVTEAGLGTGVAVDKAGAAKKALEKAIGTSSDATGASTIYGANKAATAAQTAADNAAAEAAKHTTVTGSTGTASNKDYIVVTDTRANNTDAHSYTVKTTEALDTAISTAEQNAKNYADTIISWEVI